MGIKAHFQISRFVSNEDDTELRGAVLLLGSLYWEGDEIEQDGARGRRRRKWREERLEMKTLRDLKDFPIRYGRRSDSRSGQFTIVLGGSPTGVVKIANLKKCIPLDHGCLGQRAVSALNREVEELAKAEGIWTDPRPRHYVDWGLVAIAINPESEFRQQIQECWETYFRPGDSFEESDYGEALLNTDGILKVAVDSAGWDGIDFCLLTPAKPTSRNLSAGEIAKAAKLGSYFTRTTGSGIKTADDSTIRENLERQAQSGPTRS